MNKVLQEIDFNEENNTVEVSVSYIVRSETLILQPLSEELELRPTRLWNKGEEYLGKQFNPSIKKVEQIKRKRTYSIWELDSSCFVSSKKVEDHVNYLGELLLPKKDIINRLLCDNRYLIKVNIYKKSCADVIEYYINPKSFEKLILLCNDLRFSNYYVPIENDDK